MDAILNGKEGDSDGGASRHQVRSHFYWPRSDGPAQKVVAVSNGKAVVVLVKRVDIVYNSLFWCPRSDSPALRYCCLDIKWDGGACKKSWSHFTGRGPTALQKILFTRCAKSLFGGSIVGEGKLGVHVLSEGIEA
jgi:hypothetical protein